MGEAHDYDDMDVAGSTWTSSSSSSRRARQREQQNHELLVPRGLDLLPSMRAPRRLPPTTTANGGSNSGSRGDDGDNRDGDKAADPKKAIEYVPWIGGSASLGGLKAGEKGMMATTPPAPAPAPAANGIEDRVRWFPRGLPMEPTAAGGKGQDERESAMFNTRASMAIDRLGEQVGETARRQAEMETKRREKVSERASERGWSGPALLN